MIALFDSMKKGLEGDFLVCSRPSLAKFQRSPRLTAPIFDIHSGNRALLPLIVLRLELSTIGGLKILANF